MDFVTIDILSGLPVRLHAGERNNDKCYVIIWLSTISGLYHPLVVSWHFLIGVSCPTFRFRLLKTLHSFTQAGLDKWHFALAVLQKSSINCIWRHRLLHRFVPALCSVPVHRFVLVPFRLPCRTVSFLSLCLLTIYSNCSGYGRLNFVHQDAVVVPYFGILHLFAFTYI